MLSDKERIFIHIIQRLNSTQVLGPLNKPYASEPYKDNVHFAPWRNPEPGDLVLCQTGAIDRFKIGFYKQRLGYSSAIIREIGTDNLCNYDNESFVPIVGIDPLYLLEGEFYLFYLKVIKAFKMGGEYVYRFGDIHFEGKTCFVSIREYFGGSLSGGISIPFEVKFNWNKRMSIKAVLEALRAGGYGSRKFEMVKKESES